MKKRTTALIFLFFAAALVVAVSLAVSSSDGVPSGRSPSSEAIQRASRAAFVVHGNVVSVENTYEDIGGQQVPYHVAVIDVSEFIKGDPFPNPIEVQDLGHRGPDVFETYTEAVTFVPGDEVILFLGWLGPEDNRYLSPYGLRRGMFTIVHHPELGDIALDANEYAIWTEKEIVERLDTTRPLKSDDFLSILRSTLR